MQPVVDPLPGLAVGAAVEGEGVAHLAGLDAQQGQVREAQPETAARDLVRDQRAVGALPPEVGMAVVGRRRKRGPRRTGDPLHGAVRDGARPAQLQRADPAQCAELAHAPFVA